MEETKEISVQKAQSLIENNEVSVIDVRESEEVLMGMIENAIHIPLSEIPHRLDLLSKDNSYVVVCRSGARSANAADYLNERGFDAYNMQGGMNEWTGEVII